MAFLATEAHLIAYQDSGEAYLPALFMAHPLGMSRDVWVAVCDQLHGHYRCIRWDFPGHGSSGAAAATNKTKAAGNAKGKQFVKQPKNVAKKTAKYRSK